MTQLIEQIGAEKEVNQICKKYALNINLLKSLFILRMKGFNNKEVAQKLKVHRVTVQRYTHALKKLTESEFDKIRDYVFRGEDETNN